MILIAKPNIQGHKTGLIVSDDDLGCGVVGRPMPMVLTSGTKLNLTDISG